MTMTAGGLSPNLSSPHLENGDKRTALHRFEDDETHRLSIWPVTIKSWVIIVGITILRSFELCLPGVSSHHHPPSWADQPAIWPPSLGLRDSQDGFPELKPAKSQANGDELVALL